MNRSASAISAVDLHSLGVGLSHDASCLLLFGRGTATCCTTFVLRRARVEPRASNMICDRVWRSRHHPSKVGRAHLFVGSEAIAISLDDRRPKCGHHRSPTKRHLVVAKASDNDITLLDSVRFEFLGVVERYERRVTVLELVHSDVAESDHAGTLGRVMS